MWALEVETYGRMLGGKDLYLLISLAVISWERTGWIVEGGNNEQEVRLCAEGMVYMCLEIVNLES